MAITTQLYYICLRGVPYLLQSVTSKGAKRELLHMAIVKMKTREYSLPTTMPQSSYPLGCDPEFFIRDKKSAKVVGSELLLGSPTEKLTANDIFRGDVIVDGVQIEINPRATHCRANLANSIAGCFRALRAKMANTEFVADFSTTVEITPEELQKLNENSRKFGCAPSLNNNTDTISVIPYKGDEYMKRSAGGHIHIGIGAVYHKDKDAIQRLCYMMDILVGIPSVLLDRDPGNIERRKVYGRAGEYRLPQHGFEYRTLSNFWLRGYPIMSLVFGLTKIAAAIAIDNYERSKRQSRSYTQYDSQDLYHLILDTINSDDIGGVKSVENAINNNDFDLAYRIWNSIEPFILQTDSNFDTSFRVGIGKTDIAKFHYLIWKGMDHFFPRNTDFITYWASLPDAHKGGIHDTYNSRSFINNFSKDTPIILEQVIRGLMGKAKTDEKKTVAPKKTCTTW